MCSRRFECCHDLWSFPTFPPHPPKPIPLVEFLISINGNPILPFPLAKKLWEPSLIAPSLILILQIQLVNSTLKILLISPASETPVQFSSVAQSFLTLCDPMNRSTTGLPVHHQLLEFTQTHVHRVGDAIQPSHPQSSPSPPAPNPSQHQSLFQ